VRVRPRQVAAVTPNGGRRPPTAGLTGADGPDEVRITLS